MFEGESLDLHVGPEVGRADPAQLLLVEDNAEEAARLEGDEDGLGEERSGEAVHEARQAEWQFNTESFWLEFYLDKRN